MHTFNINLQSSTQIDQLNNIISFIGEDASGKFGILPNHVRMMTCLKFGLCKFIYKNSTIEYLAIPAGVLYFCKNTLTINAQYFLRDVDYNKLAQSLKNLVEEKERNIKSIRETLNNIDESILKRIWKLSEKGNI